MIASVLTPEEREEVHRLLRHLMRAFPGKTHGLSVSAADVVEDAPGA